MKPVFTPGQLFKMVAAATAGELDAIQNLTAWVQANPAEAQMECRRNFRLKQFIARLTPQPARVSNGYPGR